MRAKRADRSRAGIGRHLPSAEIAETNAVHPESPASEDGDGDHVCRHDNRDHGDCGGVLDSKQAKREHRADDEARGHPGNGRENDDKAEDGQQGEIDERVEHHAEGETRPEEMRRRDQLDGQAGDDDGDTAPALARPDNPVGEGDRE